MIRVLSIAAPLCVVLGFVLLADDTRNVVPALLLMLGGIAVTIFLALRRVVLMARRVVSDARAFVSGDVQRARLVRIEDPKGLFFPASAAVLELEGEDGRVHRFERDIPIPFLTAWSYRLAKRLPFLRTIDIERIREMAAFELRREGLRIGVSRPQPKPEAAP